MGKFDAYRPALAMVGLQFCYAGLALFTKAALKEGMSPRVFVVYRQFLAALIMGTLSCISTRRSSCRSPLGLKTYAWIVAASLIGVTANQNAYFEGLHLASSTAASALTNLIPGITFVLAAIFGLEQVNVRSLRSVAKILGTVCCVSGAICMALIKGPELLNTEFLPPKSILISSSGGDNWLLGCVFLFGSSFFWSLWMIMQVPISEGCPDHLYSSALMCFFAALESTAITLYFERDPEEWKLNSIAVASCLYAGVAQAVSFFVQAWCISQRGPLFAAMFNPLCTVIVAFFAAMFLHEVTYTGSLVGALAVIIGLYIVLWGKAKDQEQIKGLQKDQAILVDESVPKKSCNGDLDEPLLYQKSDDVDGSEMNGKV